MKSASDVSLFVIRWPVASGKVASIVVAAFGAEMAEKIGHRRCAGLGKEYAPTGALEVIFYNGETAGEEVCQ